MPRRDDLHKILILGSGPIVIGQAAEFDYSGTQACKALRSAGYEVVLINSNPATIMTDPDVADRTYVEPLTPTFVEKVIVAERPDALLPTLGGQTALNLAKTLHETGVLARHGVELIGANYDAIQKGEDRQRFQQAMAEIGIATPAGKMIASLDEALEFVHSIGYPAIIRPSFTLGGTGGGIAYDEARFRSIIRQGLHDSPVHTVLVERSVLGWKEFELEVMRDTNDTVVIICSIENFDPMGVHTGDSITVAPTQTLSDKEYQRLRDHAIAIIREIGVDTGGSNIQFAVNPVDGAVIVIEMNPRVSRSSALASKATGYPIAKIAALLAVGYHLDELPNDITKETKAAFEPSIDYVVTKIPRFAFEKFPATSDVLGTQMRSVGEVMAIGRTFKESLQKAIRSLELDVRSATSELTVETLEARLYPNPRRLPALLELLRRGRSVAYLFEKTWIDPWFLSQLEEIVRAEGEIRELGAPVGWSWEEWREVKRLGFSDADIGQLTNTPPSEIRAQRIAKGQRPVYKTVDTCAAEFEAYTPYHYSTYEWEDEVVPSDRRKVVILGSGPNRIGQGVEFDYATVHAVWALREAGFETIMINSNPETVSTDYDTADRLYFEPLTFEDVLNVIEHERPEGVIVQLGGQTPLKLARALTDAGVPIWGTSADAIHFAEDRDAFHELCARLGVPQPAGGVAATPERASELAHEIGYPVMVRPSYVLGGRAMKVVASDAELAAYLAEVYAELPDAPSILVDEFVAGAIEVDVDALCDGETTVVAGIMEHVEAAGVHSGDSACVTPPATIPEHVQEVIRAHTIRLAEAIGVRGLINVQFVIQNDEVLVIEANPRASRTIPYLSKAIGHPLAKYAALIAAGRTLREIGFTRTPEPRLYSAKEVVLPFLKFTGVAPTLGPEMRSTGESMGISEDPYRAYLKALAGANVELPSSGRVRLLGAGAAALAERFTALGFTTTSEHPADLEEIADDALLIDIEGTAALRRALEEGVPYFSTLEAATWTLTGLERTKGHAMRVRALQDVHSAVAAPGA
ncbi:MAG: carbamoyl-phosphate synthase large subunit [Trueperaceae bacterium]|nr:carbamoyl-phosphate synthase large subunit [Trueperaceae bacterium]